jgi:hypothetical protein
MKAAGRESERNGRTKPEEEDMNDAKYFLKLTERCHRLATECTDPRTASHLTILGDEFLNKAAQIGSKLAAEHNRKRATPASPSL